MDGQQARSALRTFQGAADICKTALASPDPEGAIAAMLEGLVDGLGFLAARVVLPGDTDTGGGGRWRHAPEIPLSRFPALPLQMFEEAFREGWSRRAASDGVPLPEGVAGALVLALRGKGRSSGSMQLLAANEDALGDLTVELLGCLAGQVAQVLDRQRLLREAVESRDYLEGLMHAAGDAIIATDTEGIVRRWNPAAERLFGFSASEAAGLPISRLWSAEEARAAERLFREVAEGQGVRQQRSRRLHQDGHEVDVLLTLSPIRDAGGRVVGVSGIIRDLSHQIRLESRCEAMGHRASESEQKYRTLLQASPEAIFLLDPEALAIREVNPRACQLFARTARELVDRSLPELLEGDVAAAVRELRSAAGSHSHRPREIRIRDRQGKVRTLEIIASPVRCGGTSLLQVIGRDVTDRRQAEAEKEILQDRLIQSEKLSVMGELLSGVAHELNNPLTGVIGYAQLLRDGCGPDELERNLERIQEEARRCHRIVQNLLAFSRKRRPQRLPIDIHRVLEETLDLRAYQMRVDNIWMVKDFQDDLPVVEGDAHQLQQVFMNLVTNAHQALASTGKGGVLTVSTRAARGFVEVRVSDNGPGIPDRIRRRIFEPFFTTKGAGQGTGLGLSICHGIVTGHGGRLSVSSRPGVETTFVVEIPTGAADSLRAAAPADEERRREPSRERGEVRETPRRVLVVDDEESIREFLEEALQARGHEVDTAANGLVALDRLRSARYDAVITDLKMPGMNGRQLFESIRRDEPELARRVIFATGDLVAADTMEFLRGTGNTYLEKPFSLRSIAEALDRLGAGEG